MRLWKMAMSLVIAAVFAAAVSGCATPARAHYEADRKYLDGSGKRLLKYVDDDPTLDADTKALYHSDWDTFDLDVRHALEGK